LGDGSLAGTDMCAPDLRCRPGAAPVVQETGDPLDDIVHVANAVWHACAVTRDGAVLCWGQHDRGQLGHAGNDLTCTTAAPAACSPMPALIDWAPDVSVPGSNGLVSD
jgi:alpha-tubulin suppressor-like RCC1 family protein